MLSRLRKLLLTLLTLTFVVVIGLLFNGCQASRSETALSNLPKRLSFIRSTSDDNGELRIDARLLPSDLSFKPTLTKGQDSEHCVFATSWTFTTTSELLASKIRPAIIFYVKEEGAGQAFQKVPEDISPDSYSFILTLAKGKKYLLKSVVELRSITDSKAVDERFLGVFSVDLRNL